jgi:hypothetical protein
MWKKCLLVCATVLAVMAMGVGCSQQGTLSVAELTSAPERYNGKEVTVEGFYFSGFEITALSGELVPSTYEPGNVAPKPPLIWVEGNMGEDVYEQLYVQTNTPSGYPEHYGKVKIAGIFQYGGKYGHLDAYDYKITASRGELLEWSPPNN